MITTASQSVLRCLCCRHLSVFNPLSTLKEVLRPTCSRSRLIRVPRGSGKGTRNKRKGTDSVCTLLPHRSDGQDDVQLPSGPLHPHRII